VSNHHNHLDNHLEDRTRERLTGCIEMARRPGTGPEGEAACTAIGRIVLSNPWLTTGMVVHTSAPPWRDMACACARHRDMLNQWEREFLAGLWRFPKLSPKQSQILKNIEARLRAGGCAI
jgi:hypothetical protein